MIEAATLPLPERRAAPLEKAIGRIGRIISRGAGEAFDKWLANLSNPALAAVFRKLAA